MRVLALNCGSSSIRCAVIDTGKDRRIAARHEELNGRPHEAVLDLWTRAWRGEDGAEVAGVEAVGHRVVHGGEHFKEAARLDAQVVSRIEALSHWAPLHNPANLAGIHALAEAFPGLPQVVVFDTAFHQSLPEHAYLYAIPHALYRDHAIRRYGFHGISHQSAAKRACQTLGLELSNSRILVAHLGHGCSATAVQNGRSLDTSMGLSPLEGLVMGTRSGDVDPGLHERIAPLRDLDVNGVTRMLNRESGMLGLSELSGDLRQLEEAVREGHAGAKRALDVMSYRLAKTLASLLVPMGGLDALVFTGGMGENSADLRSRCASWLGALDIDIDPEKNAQHGSRTGGVVSPDGSTPVVIVPCDEETAIAEETARTLQAKRPG